MEQILEDAIDEIKKPLIIELQQKEQEIEELAKADEESKRKFLQFELERKDMMLQEKEQLESFQRSAVSMISKLEKAYLPIGAALFAFTFLLLQFFFNESSIIGAIRITAGIIAVLFAISIGVLKAKLFGIHEKSVSYVVRRQKINNFKQNL